MSRKSLYPVARMVRLGCGLLDIDPAEVLSQAGLPADHLQTETHGVNARAYLDVWTALVGLGSATAPDAVLRLARAAARQPSHAPIIAFSASRTVRTGLQRLALFRAGGRPRLSIALPRMSSAARHACPARDCHGRRIVRERACAKPVRAVAGNAKGPGWSPGPAKRLRRDLSRGCGCNRPAWRWSRPCPRCRSRPPAPDRAPWPAPCRARRPTGRSC